MNIFDKIKAIKTKEREVTSEYGEKCESLLEELANLNESLTLDEIAKDLSDICGTFEVVASRIYGDDEETEYLNVKLKLKRKK